jgi:hypothetical protein
MAVDKPPPQLGVVGRAGTGAVFDLMRWAPSNDAATWVEHFWSVSWDLRGREPFDSSVIAFPAMHITHEWGTDTPRHGHPLPSTLIQGVVEQVFTTTLSEQGTVDGADLAVRLGWYDQAHFINDFRSMLGCTPGEYATRHG